jgi:hypothetical protein
VYGIVSQGDGWIQVDSKPRQGTTFRIYWPRVTAVPTIEKSHVELPDDMLCGAETVLVVFGTGVSSGGLLFARHGESDRIHLVQEVGKVLV